MFRFIGLVAVLGLSACGGAGKKNVEACEDWLASMSCGTFDFTTVYDCTIYEETTCDISEYFDCLAGGECDDTLGIWTAPVDCTVPTCE